MDRFKALPPGGMPDFAMAHVPALPGPPLDDAVRSLAVADGCSTGSETMVDGYTWNPADPARAERFMEATRS